MNGFPSLPTRPYPPEPFRVQSRAEFLAELERNPKLRAVHEKFTTQFVGLLNWHAQSVIVKGAVALVLAFALTYWLAYPWLHAALGWLLSLHPIWPTIILVWFAKSLYSFRCMSLLVYGVVETLFGLCVTYDVFAKAQPSGLQTVEVVKLIGGVFIMVRGFDNIGKWIERNKIGVKFWHEWFGHEFEPITENTPLDVPQTKTTPA